MPTFIKHNVYFVCETDPAIELDVRIFRLSVFFDAIIVLSEGMESSSL